MPPDQSNVSERVASLEVRVGELAQVFHDQADRQERHQEVMLKEISELRQLLHTAKTLGKITIWFGSAFLALISGMPGLIQWLNDHIAFKS